MGNTGVKVAPLQQAGMPVLLLLAAGVILLDRLTKILIVNTVTLHASHPVIPGFFDIVHVRNEGIAFGLFAGSPSAVRTLLLVLVSTVALGAVTYLLWTSGPSASRQRASLSLILGGALGNLFDRLHTGSVVDFLDFFIGAWHWPAFNVADSAIVVGGGWLLLHLSGGEKPGRR